MSQRKVQKMVCMSLRRTGTAARSIMRKHRVIGIITCGMKNATALRYRR